LQEVDEVNSWRNNSKEKRFFEDIVDNGKQVTNLKDVIGMNLEDLNLGLSKPGL